MITFCRVVLSAFLLLLVTSCANHGFINDLPESDKDFQLPPTQLLEKFPDVKHLHTEHMKKIYSDMTVNKIQTLYGEPNSHQRDWMNYVGGKTTFAAIFNMPTTGNMGLSLGMTSLFYVLSPLPNDIHEWKKGKYTLQTRSFNNPYSKNENRIFEWKWLYKDSTDGSSVDFLANNDPKYFSFRMQYSRGGDEIGSSQDGELTVDAGDNTYFSLGYRIPIYQSITLKQSIGRKYSGYLIPISGGGLDQYPIESLLSYGVPLFKININIGSAIYLDSLFRGTFRDKAGFEQNPVPLGISLSGTIELEIDLDNKNSYGFRYERLSYEIDDDYDLEASSFGFFLAQYF